MAAYPYTNHQAKKGSSYARRARKVWMLAHFGNGTTCACTHCGCELTYSTVEADRVVPGSRGGTYRRDNLQPSCTHDNRSRQDRLDWVPALTLA